MSKTDTLLRKAWNGLIHNPTRTLRILSKRLVPLQAMREDPGVYQAISSWTFGRAPRRPILSLFPEVDDETVTIFRPFDRDPETSLTPTEILSLCALVQCRQPRRILEVGTFEGNTTLNLAANSDPKTQITTVDLPEEGREALSLEISDEMRNATDFGRVGRQFRDTPYAARIRQVFGDSAQLDWSTLGGPFDLIFLDGCHAEAYVRSDTEAALGCLAADGIIVWHDYGVIDDVSRAVDSFSAELEVFVILGTSLAVGFR